MGTDNDEPDIIIRVEFIKPADADDAYWEAEDPGPRPPGRSVGGFTVQVQMGGRTSNKTSEADR
jgi:hypothetical protein